jgi:hypothetical protein
MNLLKIKIDPFVRTIWKSLDIRKEWEPKIALACSAYNRLERMTVAKGMRICTTAHIDPDKMEASILDLANSGLSFLPIYRVGAYQGYAHTHPPVIPGKPWTWYGVVAKSAEQAAEFVNATKHNDHLKMGELLGYPKCCTEFFADVWPQGFIDPIWQSAGEKSDIENSILWYGYRYIGARLIPHLSCSFTCEESLKLATSWIELGIAEQIKGIDELLELLSLPCEWDCFKGIAQIKTDYFRIVTNSVPCDERHIVRKS